MSLNLLEKLNINNNIEKNLEISSNSIITEKEQTNFLQTNLGKAVDWGINLGIRTIMPDVIEDKVVEIKDTLLEEGIKPAIDKTIEHAINLGKSILGIATGKFENIEQASDAVKKGGLIDSISDILDSTLKKAKNNKIINQEIAELIKVGKDTILDNISDNIENSFTNQIKSVEKIEKNIDKWQEAYNEKNFENMEKYYKKINNELEKVLPLEEIIKQARQLENLHSLIKNNGKDFNLSKEELSLVNKLI